MTTGVRNNATVSVSIKPDSKKFKTLCATDIYGEDVFNLKAMKAYLPKDVYKQLLQTIKLRSALDPEIAEDVASAMKQWAVSKGATHYTHWFQPLTDATAEKHEAFIESDGNGGVILDFSGKNLVCGEPDASSFPSGGLRATFEARGYTAWDPTSPAFIKRTGNTATLCIPTAFCSYTGEALDKKTPLLRSIEAVTRQTKRLLACFGINGEEVGVSLGLEQEYFLVDRATYDLRLDLRMCGRTLFGRVPPKHQQMEDHYFGSIKTRVLSFMMEVDQELWRLGIPAKTRHNEVAPGQFELAPIFEDLNLAVDHNMMVMETLRIVAERYDFVCLLHEKPYAGINGSGKHNNWSLSLPGRGSLFTPGNNPQDNALFLTMMCAVLTGVDEHADLIRAAVANAGNEYRLGAAEAPPAIISVFLGDVLTEIIEQIGKEKKTAYHGSEKMNIGVQSIPALPRDSSDRNRTSPFAFTGNKFEFRAVGSSQNCGWPMTILNTVMSDSIGKIADILEPFAQKKEFHAQLQKLLSRLVKEHKRIIFNGDGYRDAWISEAKKRGLPHLRSVADSLAVFNKPENVALFDRAGVLSKSELHARYEVHWEIYIKQLLIESETAVVMTQTQYMPAVVCELNAICAALSHMQNAKVRAGTNTLHAQAERLGALYAKLPEECHALRESMRIHDPDGMKAGLAALRETVDTLEGELNDTRWPVPTYAEMVSVI